MNIAIVGSSGYISGFLLSRLSKDHQILKIDRSGEYDEYLELENPEDFSYDSLDNIDFVVLTAAVSSPDRCASDYDTCWNVNVTGTKHFINEALHRNCKVLFFSSDAVFGDIPGEIYTEKSKTEAKTPYGTMKKAIEDEFKYNPNFKCIRLSYVASAKDRFISYCLNCINNNEEADIFHPFYRNVISVSDVVNVVDWLINNWNTYEPFVLNVAGKELVSRVRMADEINRLLNNKLKYKISMPNEDFYKNRPAITQMKSLYLSKYKIIEDNTFTEKLKEELKSIKGE